MTAPIDEVRRMVDEVRAAAVDSDHEAARITERELRLRALLAIAQGAPNAVELAAAALATEGIDFQRWTS